MNGTGFRCFIDLTSSPIWDVKSSRPLSSKVPGKLAFDSEAARYDGIVIWGSTFPANPNLQELLNNFDK